MEEMILCPFRKNIGCGTRHCISCGWNPVVEAARKQVIRETLVISRPQKDEPERWLIGSGPFPKGWHRMSHII